MRFLFLRRQIQMLVKNRVVFLALLVKLLLSILGDSNYNKKDSNQGTKRAFISTPRCPIMSPLQLPT
jgi:hypothetical protein